MGPCETDKVPEISSALPVVREVNDTKRDVWCNNEARNAFEIGSEDVTMYKVACFCSSWSWDTNLLTVISGTIDSKSSGFSIITTGDLAPFISSSICVFHFSIDNLFDRNDTKVNSFPLSVIYLFMYLLYDCSEFVNENKNAGDAVLEIGGACGDK